jgi:hypothetical protein
MSSSAAEVPSRSAPTSPTSPINSYTLWRDGSLPAPYRAVSRTTCARSPLSTTLGPRTLCRRPSSATRSQR